MCNEHPSLHAARPYLLIYYKPIYYTVCLLGRVNVSAVVSGLYLK